MHLPEQAAVLPVERDDRPADARPVATATDLQWIVRAEHGKEHVAVEVRRHRLSTRQRRAVADVEEAVRTVRRSPGVGRSSRGKVQRPDASTIGPVGDAVGDDREDARELARLAGDFELADGVATPAVAQVAGGFGGELRAEDAGRGIGKLATRDTAAQRRPDEPRRRNRRQVLHLRRQQGHRLLDRPVLASNLDPVQAVLRREQVRCVSRVGTGDATRGDDAIEQGGPCIAAVEDLQRSRVGIGVERRPQKPAGAGGFAQDEVGIRRPGRGFERGGGQRIPPGDGSECTGLIERIGRLEPHRPFEHPPRDRLVAGPVGLASLRRPARQTQADGPTHGSIRLALAAGHGPVAEGFLGFLQHLRRLDPFAERDETVRQRELVQRLRRVVDVDTGRRVLRRLVLCDDGVGKQRQDKGRRDGAAGPGRRPTQGVWLHHPTCIVRRRRLPVGPRRQFAKVQILPRARPERPRAQPVGVDDKLLRIRRRSLTRSTCPRSALTSRSRSLGPSTCRSRCRASTPRGSGRPSARRAGPAGSRRCCGATTSRAPSRP